MSDKSKIENKSISEKVHKRAEELLQKDMTELTIAEKLMIRGWEQRATIEFKSEILGCNIPVVVRIPLALEIQHIQELQMKMIKLSQTAKPDGVTKQLAEDAVDELYHILADLCVDESLNYEFFKAGYFTLSDMMEILMSTTMQKAAQVQDAGTFR